MVLRRFIFLAARLDLASLRLFSLCSFIHCSPFDLVLLTYPLFFGGPLMRDGATPSRPLDASIP